jgi:hypothetical protein
MATAQHDAASQALIDKLRLENEAFFAEAKAGLTSLFAKARQKNELHFALSLIHEMRGIQGPGFNTTDECFVAIEDYLSFLKSDATPSRLKVRVALAFYCHLGEASGFYEIPKNMLRVAEGQNHSLWPFRDIVEIHKTTGDVIAPNANKVMKNLAGHSATLGMTKLADVFKNLIDSDLRNGFSHADYVVWNDGIRLPKRNGGGGLIVSYERFDFHLNRALGFFHILKEIRQKALESYNPPKTFRGHLANSPETNCTVSFEPSGNFTIKCG